MHRSTIDAWNISLMYFTDSFMFFFILPLFLCAHPALVIKANVRKNNEFQTVVSLFCTASGCCGSLLYALPGFARVVVPVFCDGQRAGTLKNKRIYFVGNVTCSIFVQ